MLSHVLGMLQKEACRLKLDDSVTRKKAGGRRPREACTHRGFPQRSLYTEEFSTHRKSYTYKSLLCEAFAHKRVGAFIDRSFYTKKSLHKGGFTHRRICTQKLLRKEVWTQRASTHRCVDTHSYTETPLHREVFAQRRLYMK